MTNGSIYTFPDISSSSYNSYFVSNKIPIDGGEHYTSVWGYDSLTAHIFETTNRQAWIYDEQDNPLRAIDLLTDVDFDTPINGSYIRICVYKSTSKEWEDAINIVFGKAMLVKGYNLPETYVSYGETQKIINSNMNS